MLLLLSAARLTETHSDKEHTHTYTQTKKARRQGVEDVVGASSMPLPSIVVDSNGHKPDATGAGGGAGGGAGAGAGAAKKKPPSDAEDVSLTFQQRVEALAASMRSSDEEVAAADEAEEAERAAAGPAARRRLGIAAGSSRGGTGGIDSVQNVLVQALQVQDDSLLEYCLAVSDQRVIKATVARLPTSTVLPFLTRYYNARAAAVGCLRACLLLFVVVVVCAGLCVALRLARSRGVN